MIQYPSGGCTLGLSTYGGHGRVSGPIKCLHVGATQASWAVSGFNESCPWSVLAGPPSFSSVGATFHELCRGARWGLMSLWPSSVANRQTKMIEKAGVLERAGDSQHLLFGWGQISEVILVWFFHLSAWVEELHFWWYFPLRSSTRPWPPDKEEETVFIF